MSPFTGRSRSESASLAVLSRGLRVPVQRVTLGKLLHLRESLSRDWEQITSAPQGRGEDYASSALSKGPRPWRARD